MVRGHVERLAPRGGSGFDLTKAALRGTFSKGGQQRAGEGGMVFVNGVGAPAVADMLPRDQDDLDAGVINPRGVGGIVVNMSEGRGGHLMSEE